MKKFILPAAIIAAIAVLVSDPARYSDSVRAGIQLFSFSVLPTLFPFFFLTRLLTASGGTYELSRLFRKPAALFFKLPPQAGTVFFLAALSGYPVGAKLISDCAAAGEITSDEARRMSALCSTSGPFFVIAAVGASIFGSANFGYIVFACHLLAALVTGLMVCNLTAKKNVISKATVISQQSPVRGNIISDSVYDSLVSVALVGGYITVFYMLADMLILSHVLTPLIAAAEWVLSALSMPVGLAKGIVTGILEVTRGCKDLAGAGAGLKAAAALCCTIISFGGISVNLQALAFLSKCGVKARTYLLYKLIHAVIALALCAAAANLFL